MNWENTELLHVIISFSLSGALGYFNTKMINLMGYFQSEKTDEKSMMNIFFSLLNLLILTVLTNNFPTLKSKSYVYCGNGYVLPILLTFLFSYILTINFFPVFVKRIYKDINNSRKRLKKTPIVDENVESIFYEKAVGNAVYIFSSEGKPIVRGTIIYAPDDHNEGSRLLIQPFDGEHVSTTFDELVIDLENNRLKGFIFIDLESDKKAVIIES